MRIVIINGVEGGRKEEIYISQYMEVRDIKSNLDAKYGGQGGLVKYYYRFIHGNLILYENVCIKHYRIAANDEIWFGKIENFLKSDDVIVEIFLLGFIPTSIKLSRIYPMISNIWNARGRLMRDDQMITDSDEEGHYKLIICYCDIESCEMNYSFEECCDLHDRSWVEQFLIWDQVRDENNNDSRRMMLIKRLDKVRLSISSNDFMDPRLRKPINEFPRSYINAKYLFGMDLTDRIWEIVMDYWTLARPEYDDSVNEFIVHYFRNAIELAILFHINSIPDQIDCTDKSIQSIVLKALEYIIAYLSSASKNWRYWIKLLLKQNSLKQFSESEMERLLDNLDTDQIFVNIKVNGIRHRMYVTRKVDTVMDAKNVISHITGIDTRQMLCIKQDADSKPCDGDLFDHRFVIEIALSMEDVEKLKLLAEGGFGAVYLYQDKVSMEKFVVKRQKEKNDDLYREISLQFQLQSSEFIQCYSGLYLDNGDLYMAMKYLSKGSLRAYLKQVGGLVEGDISRICHQILLQIEVIHRHKIIHRDINSKNIVFDEFHNAKLIDFGISKNVNGISPEQLSEKLKKYINGNMRYLAPEYLNNEPYSEKVDIWSFGAVTVEMFTGFKPYHSLKKFLASMRIAKTKKITFKSPKPMSKELDNFTRLCLNPDPQLRSNVFYLKQTLFIQNYLNRIAK